ncbi:MAG: WD40 repeat domain-containing protein, partial [Acidobacteriota bacterium]
RAWLLDGTDGSLIAVLADRPQEQGSCPHAFDAGGDRLVVAVGGGIVRLFDVRNGIELDRLRGHETSVRRAVTHWDREPSLVFGSDGSRILSLDVEGHCRLWDASAHEARVLRHRPAVSHVVFSPDGARLASRDVQRRLHLWDSTSGRHVSTLRARQGRTLGDVTFSPDGELLASIHGDVLSLWSTSTGEPVSTHQARPRVVWRRKAPEPRLPMTCWHPEGELLAVSDPTHELELDSLRVAGRPDLETWSLVADALAFTPDGRELIAATGSEIERWDVATRRRGDRLSGHHDLVRALACSPTSQRVASASEDGTIRIWNLELGVQERVLSGHSRAVHAVAWSPDGRRLVSGSADQTLIFWDPETGDRLATLTDHEGTIHSLAFSPDGRILASASADHSVRLWETTPLHRRLIAREERVTLEQELCPEVETLLTEGATPEELVERFRTEHAADPTRRRVALDCVLTTSDTNWSRSRRLGSDGRRR